MANTRRSTAHNVGLLSLLLTSPRRKWLWVTVVILLLLLYVHVYHGSTSSSIRRPSFTVQKKKTPNQLPPFTCEMQSKNLTCPPPPPTMSLNHPKAPSPVCPEYFRWIHEDLRPWRETGIKKETMDKASKLANFRLVIVGGKAYVERYQMSVQPREVFTLWSLLQLLRRYPGRLPDVDLAFNGGDLPRVTAFKYRRPQTTPPALFHYCSAHYSLDILFPDWSFWGWPDIKMKPWALILEEVKEENKRKRWVDRVPYAYWKGNPGMGNQRRHMVNKCNATTEQDWNAHLFVQDWRAESRQGFKDSGLPSQCKYRYKIYIEGRAWSASQKYIMACDSPTLFVTAKYYEFFTRSLMPLQHYWPIKNVDTCDSIKFAVEWGNQHKEEAEAIGRNGSKFMMENLTMDHVYDYMFHLLNEYSKLLRYKPTVPSKAVEICSEAMACQKEGLTKEFMMRTKVNVSQSSDPCALPPPFDPSELKAMQEKKLNLMRQVKVWEKNNRSA